MKLPIAFHPEAQAEMDAAYAWYEGQRRSLGEEFLADVSAILARITERPTMYATIRGEVRRVVMRRFP